MSHNIHYNEQTQKHSFFSVKEKPWHSLGQIVEQYLTSAEAMAAAGLDYSVEKRPLFTLDHLNTHDEPDDIQIPELEVPNYFATVRADTDDVLGVVGKDYSIVQNRDAFSFFDSIVGGDGIMYETAGALGKGERIFITAKLPGYIRVGSDDLIEKYLFLTTSHDGFGSITAAFTPIRIVCQNTLNAALRAQSNAVKIRHTQNAKQRLEQAHILMGISSQLSDELENIFNRWTRLRITDPMLKDLIRLAMCPNKQTYAKLQSGKDETLSTVFTKMCDEVYSYAQTHASQQTATARGNLFGAYNAVTGYFQNVRRYKSDEAKLDSILYGGTAAQRGQKAFDLCTHLAAGGELPLFTN